jgi:hypothetical protein
MLWANQSWLQSAQFVELRLKDTTMPSLEAFLVAIRTRLGTHAGVLALATHPALQPHVKHREIPTRSHR